jgi:hypothetical protein
VISLAGSRTLGVAAATYLPVIFDGLNATPSTPGAENRVLEAAAPVPVANSLLLNPGSMAAAWTDSAGNIYMDVGANVLGDTFAFQLYVQRVR